MSSTGTAEQLLPQPQGCLWAPVVPVLPGLGSGIPKQFVFVSQYTGLPPLSSSNEGSPVPSSTHTTRESHRSQNSSWTKRAASRGSVWNSANPGVIPTLAQGCSDVPSSDRGTAGPQHHGAGLSLHFPQEAGCFHSKQPWPQRPVLRIPPLQLLFYRTGGHFHHRRKEPMTLNPSGEMVHYQGQIEVLWPLHGSRFYTTSSEVTVLKKL